jgi:hypothetical protein
MKRSELNILARFMYLHVEFFAAPFLRTEEFNKWARQQQGMLKFSNELHEALETSKEIAHGDIDLLADYRKAIVGSPTSTGSPALSACLYSGNINGILKILNSNEKLAQSIKKHMDKKFFEEWYIDKKDHNRMQILNNKFDHTLEVYQAKKLKAIENFLPNVTISYQYDGNAKSYYENGMQKPTKIIIQSEQNNKENLDLQMLADKYNTAQTLREIIKDPHTNTLMQLVNFSKKINEKETVNKLTMGNDSDGIIALKVIGYILTTFLLGLGLCLSYMNKGTIAFWNPENWKTEDDVLLDNTKENINTVDVINHLK